MGLIKCELHGFVGALLVCPHINNYFSSKEFELKKYTSIQLPFNDDEKYLVTYWYCEKCLNQFGLNNRETLTLEEFLETYQAAFEILEPICGVCFVSHTSQVG